MSDKTDLEILAEIGGKNTRTSWKEEAVYQYRRAEELQTKLQAAEQRATAAEAKLTHQWKCSHCGSFEIAEPPEAKYLDEIADLKAKVQELRGLLGEWRHDDPVDRAKYGDYWWKSFGARVDAALASAAPATQPREQGTWERLGAAMDHADALLSKYEPTPEARLDREALGRHVRTVWIEWAREQPNPKASWLQSWEQLTEPEREVDRRIGEAIARLVLSSSSTAPTENQNRQPGHGAHAQEQCDAVSADVAEAPHVASPVTPGSSSGPTPDGGAASDWWCPTCKDAIDGSHVTYTEHHEVCGTYLGDCQPPNVEKHTDLNAKLAAANAEIERLRAELSTSRLKHKEDAAQIVDLMHERDAAREEARTAKHQLAEIHNSLGAKMATVDSALMAVEDAIRTACLDGIRPLAEAQPSPVDAAQAEPETEKEGE